MIPYPRLEARINEYYPNTTIYSEPQDINESNILIVCKRMIQANKNSLLFIFLHITNGLEILLYYFTLFPLQTLHFTPNSHPL